MQKNLKHKSVLGWDGELDSIKPYISTNWFNNTPKLLGALWICEVLA